MMTRAQQAALESVAGRSLNEGDLALLEPLVAARDDVQTAVFLSIGRKRLKHTPVGHGTLLDAFTLYGDNGGQFLDILAEQSKVNRKLYWGMKPIERGELDLGLIAVQNQLELFATAAGLEGFTAGIRAFQALGYEPDPVSTFAVSQALNAVQEVTQ